MKVRDAKLKGLPRKERQTATERQVFLFALTNNFQTIKAKPVKTGYAKLKGLPRKERQPATERRVFYAQDIGADNHISSSSDDDNGCFGPGNGFNRKPRQRDRGCQ